MIQAIALLTTLLLATISFASGSSNAPHERLPKKIEDSLNKTVSPQNLSKKTLLTKSKKGMVSIFDHSHSDWSAVLKKYAEVKGPQTYINYGALKKDPAQLNQYLKETAAVTRPEFDKWSREQQMAYLINTYNANTISWVVRHYPTKSIKKTVPFYKSVFKNEFFILFGKKASLEDLEHGILRPKYKDPMIHFGVNCASIGCPSLLNTAFTPENLQMQLKKQAKRFLRDSSRNRLDTKKKVAYISELFSWFKKDFTQNNTTLAQFIAPFITDDPQIQKDLKAGQYKMDETDYSWKLNDKK